MGRLGGGERTAGYTHHNQNMSSHYLNCLKQLIKQNAVVKRIALVLYNWKVASSNLGLDTIIPDSSFHRFPLTP
jgi:hypothetical protein